MTNILLWVVVAIVLISGALAIWLRTVTIPPEMHRTADLPDSGREQTDGSFFTTRRPADPAAALRDLADVIEDTPRTARLAGSVDEGHVSYVTRSRVMGFPDVTNLWREGDVVAIRGHLIFGKGDMGVNKRRIEGWLTRAGL